MGKWERVKLGDVATLLNGRAYKQDELLKEGKTPVLRVGNIFSNRDWYYSDLELDENKYCDKGDLLYAWSASFGPKIWDGPKVIFHYHIWKVLISKKIKKGYLFYLLQNSTKNIIDQGHGIAMIHATKSGMEQMLIPLPPIETQEQIAKTLDTTAELLALRKQQLAELDNLIKSTFYDMFGDPVENEKRWQVVEVGKVTDCIVPSRDKPRSFSGNIPWITTSDLILGWYTYRSSANIGLTESEINNVRARIIPNNSVIMCCVGDIGVTSIAGNDLVMNQQLHSFQCGNQINNIFLCIVLPFYKNQMIKLATSTTVLYMNKTSCNSTEIILPPLTLQTQFASIVTKIEEQKALVKKVIDETQRLFDSLMSEYFE